MTTHKPLLLWLAITTGSLFLLSSADNDSFDPAGEIIIPKPSGMSPFPGKYEVELLDGTVIIAHAEGNDEDVREVDEDGYTIVGTGPSLAQYEYAVVDPETEDLVPSGVKVGDRGRRNKDKRIRQGLHRGPKAKRAMADFGGQGSGTKLIRGRGNKRGRGRVGTTSEEKHNFDNEEEEDERRYRRRKLTSWTGNMKMLVIPIRFKDHASRTLPSRSDLDKLMNSMDKPVQAPTGSVRQVLLDASYGKLDLVSTVIDWVQLPETEFYYSAWKRGRSQEMQLGMEYALNYVDEQQLINFDDFDEDGDGMIDAICFLHSGYAADHMGRSTDGAHYENRIWSHKWVLFGLPGGMWRSSRGSNVCVNDYQISPALWGISGSRIARVGVIAHETGHLMGIKDLYDGDGSGIGSWGLMANSWGFPNDQWCVPTMSSWTKIMLGWLTPRTVCNTGTYSLKMSYYNSDVIKIVNKFRTNEYLLIEYRKATPDGFEYCMPGPGGLAIWHIDEEAGYYTQGYPGQDGWPQNGLHYRVALLQADGLYELEKNINRGNALDLYTPGTMIGPNTTPNTKSYQYGGIWDTGITIDNIGSTAGDTITFTITISGTSPIASPTKEPTSAPTIESTSAPTTKPTSAPVPVPVPQPVAVPSAPVEVGGSWSTIDFNNFESDFGIWNPSDTTGRLVARLERANFAFSGTNVLLIKGTHNVCTDSIDTSSFNKLRVTFSYVPVGLSSNDSFYLEINDGNSDSSWTVIEQWMNFGPDDNGKMYPNVVVDIDPEAEGITMTSEMKLRFRMNGDANSDMVSLDDIHIEAFTESEVPEATTKPTPAPIITAAPTSAPTPVPKPTGGAWSTIDFNDFESSYGIWMPSDSRMVARAERENFAFSGTSVLLIKGANYAYADSIDASSFNKLRVTFSYVPVGLSSNDDFFLEVNDGGVYSKWITIEHWIAHTHFEDKNMYENVVVELDPTTFGFIMSIKVKIRFRMSGNENTDMIFLDDIKIEGFS